MVSGRRPVFPPATGTLERPRATARQIQDTLDEGGHVELGGGTYEIDQELVLSKDDTTLEILAGSTLQAENNYSGRLLSATGRANLRVFGEGRIVCTAASVPTFTNCTSLGVSVRIETSGGAPLDYTGSGNTVRLLPSDVTVPLQDTLRLKAARILKQFNNLNDITIVDTTITSTAVIDQSSPFGRPALKLTLTSAGSGGNTEVRFATANIPTFDDHVAWRVWLDNYTRLRETKIFLGNDASYTKVNTYTFFDFDSNTQLFSGPRTLVVGPQTLAAVSASPTLVFGTDKLVAVKARFTIAANTVCIIWIDAIEIPARQRPIVCIVSDDADDDLFNDFYPALRDRGLKGTLAINSTDIDGSNKLTSAQIQTISDAGYQIASHNQTNSKLRTVYSAGIISGSSLSMSAYLAQYRDSCEVLENLGVPPEDFCYHPWVQGGVDGAAIQELRSAGVQVGRGIVSQSGAGATTGEGANVYGSGLGNSILTLGYLGLGNGVTLAQARAALANTVKYGTVWVPTVHLLAASATDSVTWARADFTALCDSIAEYKRKGQIDVLTMRELVERLSALGILDGTPRGFVPDAYARQIGHLSSANFNSTADQAITLEHGSQSWTITDILTTNIAVSLTTAAGGFYTAAAKGGTAIVAASQTYTGHTGTTTQTNRATIANSGPVSSTLYFSLTTPQGSAVTGDIFVFGKPV